MRPEEFVFYVKGVVDGKWDEVSMRLKKALEEVTIEYPSPLSFPSFPSEFSPTHQKTITTDKVEIT